MIHKTITKISNHILFRNMAALSVLKVAEYAFPLLTIPFISRKLEIDGFGLLMFVMSIYSMALIITDYGFSLSATYNISQNKENKTFLSDYVSAIFSIKFVLSLASISFILIYFLFYFDKYTIDLSTVLLLCSIVLVQCYQPQWFFQGIEKMKFITIADVLSKFSYMIFVFILVSLDASINMVLVACFISNTVSSSIYLNLIHKAGIKLKKPQKSTIMRELKFSFGFFLSRIAVSFSSNANNFVIGNFTSIRDTALFGSSEKLYSAGMGLLAPLNNALYPYLARTKNIKLLYKICISLFILSLIGTAVLSVYSADIMRIVFGAGYDEAAPLFKLFLVLIPINVVSTLFGYPAFATLGNLKYPNLTVIISGICYLFSLLFLFFTNTITKENVLYAIIITDSLTLFLRLGGFLYYKRNS